MKAAVKAIRDNLAWALASPRRGLRLHSGPFATPKRCRRGMILRRPLSLRSAHE
jgi:hypothetical protein